MGRPGWWKGRWACLADLYLRSQVGHPSDSSSPPGAGPHSALASRSEASHQQGGRGQSLHAMRHEAPYFGQVHRTGGGSRDSIWSRSCRKSASARTGARRPPCSRAVRPRRWDEIRLGPGARKSGRPGNSSCARLGVCAGTGGWVRVTRSCASPGSCSGAGGDGRIPGETSPMNAAGFSHF